MFVGRFWKITVKEAVGTTRNTVQRSTRAAVRSIKMEKVRAEG